jgi:hypothetical protein
MHWHDNNLFYSGFFRKVLVSSDNKIGCGLRIRSTNTFAFSSDAWVAFCDNFSAEPVSASKGVSALNPRH